MARATFGLMAFAAMAATTIAGAAPRRHPPSLTSEVANRMAAAALERRILEDLGSRFAVVDIQQTGFSFTASLRSHAVKQDEACMASQIDLNFNPEPTLAPKGTRPAATHISRLPMLARAVGAKQVYRLGPPSLIGWSPPMAPDPCDGVDPHLNFVEAPSANAAVLALKSLARVLDAVRKGHTDFPVDCGGAGEAACLAQIGRLDAEDVEYVTAGPSINIAFHPFERRREGGFSAYYLQIHLGQTGSEGRPAILKVVHGGHSVVV